MTRPGGLWRTLAILSMWGLVVSIACQQPTTGAPSAQPTPAKTKLTIVLSATVDFLDPHVTRRTEGFDVLVNVNEGLLARDPKTMQPIPALATSWQNPDATTWIFKLRTGVKFHNGEAFDADTVKYNFTRVVDPKLQSTIGATLAGIVKQVDVVDPTTVKITLSQPAPFFLERIARFWFVPPKESAEKGNDYVAQHPVGTGPYKFVEWKQQQSVTLVRNEDYWGTKPAFKDMVFREIIEYPTAIAELLAGNVDILATVPQDQIDAVNKSGKAKVQIVPSQVVVEVAFDQMGRTSKTPWTDKRVRQAANYAVDRESIAKNLMGGYGTPLPVSVSPLIFGYDGSIKPYPYDPNKAKQLLADAGFANGFDSDFRIYPLGSFIDEKLLAQAIASDLGKVGIRMKIIQVSSSEIGPLIREGKAGPAYIRQNENAGAFDVALGFSFLQKNGTFSYYLNEDVERLRLQAASSTNPDERKKIYSDIQKILYDDPPHIFGWAGFVLNGVANTVDYPSQPDNATRLYLAKPK